MTNPTTRLLALWTKATRRERAEGREWYARNYLLCADAGGGLGHPRGREPWPASRSCAIAAAFSPRVPWSRALTLTARAWETGEPSGHTAATLATVRRLTAAPLAELRGILRGPKVTAFYAALLGDTSAAVCDVHMFRAAGLDPDTTPHDVGARYIREAARRACEPVAQFQATVWIVRRGGSQ